MQEINFLLNTVLLAKDKLLNLENLVYKLGHAKQVSGIYIALDESEESIEVLKAVLDTMEQYFFMLTREDPEEFKIVLLCELLNNCAEDFEGSLQGIIPRKEIANDLIKYKEEILSRLDNFEEKLKADRLIKKIVLTLVNN